MKFHFTITRLDIANHISHFCKMSPETQKLTIFWPRHILDLIIKISFVRLQIVKVGKQTFETLIWHLKQDVNSLLFWNSSLFGKFLF